MAEEPRYEFSDDSQLCIVQARFEALQLGSRVVQPEHLVLGLTKAIAQPRFERLFPDAAQFAALCRSFGAATAAAPVSAEDVTYSEGSLAAIAGAYQALGPDRAQPMTPLHIMLGVHRPLGPDGRPIPASPASAILDAAGLSVEALAAVLAEGRDEC
jgi:hypothetical protein